MLYVMDIEGVKGSKTGYELREDADTSSRTI